MSFAEYYTEKKMSIGRRISNLFTNLKKYDLNVDDLSVFKQVSENGYDRLVDKIASVVEIDDWRKKKAAKLDYDKNDERTRRDYLKKYKLKVEDRVTEIYKGELKGSNELIPIGYNPVDISVYETNRNGILILMSLQKGEDVRYYIGSDNKGDRFFKAVLGMSLDTYAVLNKPKVDTSKLNYKSTIKLKDIEPEELPETPVSYIDKLEKTKDTIRDGNDNWYGFIKINNEEFSTILSKLKSIQKKMIPYVTKNIGTIYKFDMSAEENIYMLSIKNINNVVENYLVYEIEGDNSKSNSIKDLNKLLFGKFKWDYEDDVHWIKNIDMTKLPSF